VLRFNGPLFDLPLPPPSLLLFLLFLSGSLLRFRFNSIKPVLQLATPASRRFLTKIESAICKLPHFPPLLPPDINPDRCSEPLSRCFPTACCNVSRSDNDGMPSSCRDFVRKGAEIHGFVKFLTKRLNYIVVQVASRTKISR